MKKLNLLFLGMFMLTLGSLRAQCFAGYTAIPDSSGCCYSVSVDTVFGSIMTGYISFGDGTTTPIGSWTSGYHCYTTPGVHIIQGFFKCVGDTSFHPGPPFTVISGACGTDSCEAVMNINPVTVGSGFTVVNAYYSGSSGAYYQWWWGDGTAPQWAVGDPTIHTYLNGTYTICLYVYDSDSVFCDSTCMDVTFGGDSCHADFGWVNTGGYSYTFNPYYTGGSSYFWYVSDGPTNYTVMNPSHTFSGPGSYVVCLTTYDSLGGLCDSLCHTLTIGTTGLGSISERGGIRVYPTLADGSCILDASGVTSPSVVDLIGLQGQVISTWTVAPSASVEIQLGTLPSGLYLLQARSGSEITYHRLLIQH